jgi:protein-S-isoprenylcysteine O-methyltransferase Ste14
MFASALPAATGTIAFGTLIGGLWIIFLTYWVVSAITAKPTARRTAGRGVIFRVAIAAAIVLFAQASIRYYVWRRVPYAVKHVSPIEASIGVAVCALGIATAIWARAYLGRNWGMPMSLREGHELVMTGPYAFVRHPIYTGILLAVAGTTLVERFPGIVLLPTLLIYFIYAAKIEERSMKQQFPDVYPAYIHRTKMLIPFLF